MVTPNLVNEKNYVMEIEYPMALNQGKPILPAEMEATDWRALKKLYRGIPRVTDALDEKRLSKALKKLLGDLPLSGCDDPTHTFFMGLAYLGGIDVEKDYDRAAELITSAAEDGPCLQEDGKIRRSPGAI